MFIAIFMQQCINLLLDTAVLLRQGQYISVKHYILVLTFERMLLSWMWFFSTCYDTLLLVLLLFLLSFYGSKLVVLPLSSFLTSFFTLQVIFEV